MNAIITNIYPTQYVPSDLPIIIVDGIANEIILPTVMEYNAEATGEKYRDIAKAMGVEGTENMSQEEYRKAAVDAVRKLSQDVGIPADLKEIVKKEGMSINKIFEEYGETYFRNCETNLLIELQKKNNQIISCGGGVALRDENVAEMKKNGKVVLLTASPEVILERVKDNDDRPLLRGNKNTEFISNMMEQRRPKYEAAADVVVNTDYKTVEEIAEEIVVKLTRDAD